MVRSVVCESHLEDYVRCLSKTRATSVGLLIGQPSSTNKDYVIHLNKIKDGDDTNQETKGLLDIDNQHVSQHALIETRALPGGFYVLGIFVINPKSVFEDPTLMNKVKTMLVDMRHTFNSNSLLHGNCDELDGGEKLVLSYSSSSNVFGCKTVALKSEHLSTKPCDWKFQAQAMSWHSMSTFFETNDTYALEQKNGEPYDTEANLSGCVEILKQQLAKGIVYFEGGPVDGAQLIESVLKHKKDEPFLVHLYAPSQSNVDISDKAIQTFDGTMKFDGIISCNIFVHPKNTFAEAEAFIKADIIRSLMSRVQIHCDSLVQVEGAIQDSIMLNELPRRIYFRIGAKSNQICFCEYLFREEMKEAAIPQIQATLDLSVTPKELIATVEVIAEIKEEEQQDSNGAGEKIEERLSVLLDQRAILASIVVLIVGILVFLLTK
ncbi:protein odr-4 homolog [Toxorhynchites rutilus septentrionalis]|uniref:protein odr-4 homolog n=1 Tax=Toxorhynchites rutilus septentrionalis TaxID=329112 RepID=UPI002479B466|nr:protein odr-4 homolog [Toxorhynchites rutilus septentrionalis]